MAEEQSQTSDLLVRLLKWVAGALKPLADPAVHAEILASVGKDPPSAGDPSSFIDARTLDELEKMIATPSDEMTAKMTALASGAGDLLNVIESAREAVHRMEMGGHVGLLDISLDTFLHVMPNVVAMNYLRVRRPGLWSVFKLMQLLDDRAAVPFGEALSGKNWVRLLKNEEGSFRWGRDTEDQRIQTAITIGIAATLVAKFARKLLSDNADERDDSVHIRAFPGWDPSPASSTPRADRELALATTLQIIVGKEPDAFDQPDWNENRELTLTFMVPPKDIGTPLIVVGSGAGEFSRRVGAWELALSVTMDADVTDDYSITFTAKRPRLPDPWDVSRYLSIGDLILEGWLKPDDFGFKAKAIGNTLNLGGSVQKDGVTSEALGNHDASAAFDLDVTYDRKSGFDLGSTGLRFDYPVRFSAGPAQINGVHFSLGANKDDGALELVTAVGLKFKLGPFSALAEGVGFELRGLPKEVSNLGFLHLEKAGFKSPDGIGLSLELKVVKGSGYLGYDRASDQYVGAFELKLSERYGLAVTGLLATHMPDGSKGISLFLQGSLKMDPGWQAGYFEITRLGLMLGYNRRFDFDALRAGVRSGMVETLLCPPDPLADLGKTISHLTTLFPVAKGKYTIGVSVRLQRTNRITLDIGLLYDTSEEARIVIAGLLQMVLHQENRLKLAVVGKLDFQKGEILLLASIFDSKLAGGAVDGDAAILIRWKSNRTMVIAVGGFHSEYRGAEIYLPEFSKLKRFTVKLPESPVFKMTSSSYFAVTPNSLQMGGALTVWVGIENVIHLEGEISYEALLDFDPFYFNAAVNGRVRLAIAGQTIAGVRLEGRYRGPDPAQLAGKVTFEVLWWDVSYSFDRKSPGEPPPLPDPVDPVVILRSELGNPSTWNSEAGVRGEGSVRLKTDASPPGLLLHPLQPLSFVQEAIPFEEHIEKVGSRPLVDATSLHLDSVTFGVVAAPHSPISAPFARGAYRKLSAEDLFAEPAYRSMVGGASVDADHTLQAGVALQRGTDEPLEILLGATETELPSAASPSGLDPKILLEASGSMNAYRRTVGLERFFRKSA